ncbi:MAG TPA: hypothetical protein DCY45_02080, partial [Mesotoga sp.]|nr:hypothetical protein [Mesotoga sp.]
MERVFFAVLMTIFIVAAASAMYQEPQTVFNTYLQDGTFVYGGSVVLSWDVVIRNSSVVLSNLDLW